MTSDYLCIWVDALWSPNSVIAKFDMINVKVWIRSFIFFMEKKINRKFLDPCEGRWMYIFVQNEFSSEDVVVMVDMWKIR